MTEGEKNNIKDKQFKELLAEKLAEFLKEFEGGFGGDMRIMELKRKIEACNTLLDTVLMKKYYAN